MLVIACFYHRKFIKVDFLPFFYYLNLYKRRVSEYLLHIWSSFFFDILSLYLQMYTFKATLEEIIDLIVSKKLLNLV